MTNRTRRRPTGGFALQMLPEAKLEIWGRQKRTWCGIQPFVDGRRPVTRGLR